MTEYITPGRIATSIMQKEDSYESFLVLEGRSDALLFKKFTDVSRCRIEIGYGYDNVSEILKILNDRGFNFALGIIDLDFRALSNEEIEIDNIITTDYHDLEVNVISSDAFETVLRYYVQEQKLVEKYQGSYDSFRKQLYMSLKPFSHLKWLNQREKWGLMFKPTKPDGKKLDLSKFICKNELKFLGREAMIKAVLEYCNGKIKINTTKESLLKLLEEFSLNVEEHYLHNGHDLIALTALSLRRHISNQNSNAVSSEQLHKELYLAYEKRYFEETQLFGHIRQWEVKKSRRILID